MTGEKPVHSMVCRSAIVPTKEAHIVSTQPVRWAKVCLQISAVSACYFYLVIYDSYTVICYYINSAYLGG